MPWQKSSIKSLKRQFVADWMLQEFTMTSLCRRYAISRQCGYDLIKSYHEEGEEAFNHHSHSRHNHPNQTADELTQLILNTKHHYQLWGPKKIKVWLEQKHPAYKWPASSTIGEILNRHGLVKRRVIRRKVPPHTEPLRSCNAPNQIWSADYKGQFRLLNHRYCYPLTITDNFSRYLLCCNGFDAINAKKCIKSFETVFYNYGLPDAIRTDNGYPFASTALGGLTRLSIWLLKLGVMPERIDPGCPQQNPRHERMHRTLKAGINLNLKNSFGQQQEWFENFRSEYNEQRPHEALNFKTPKEIYVASMRNYPLVVPEVTYPNEFLIRKIRTNGEMKYFGKRYFISELLHGEPIGLEMIDDDRAIVYFAQLKLGIIDSKLDKIIRP